jgi:hypothetical protein
LKKSCVPCLRSGVPRDLNSQSGFRCTQCKVHNIRCDFEVLGSAENETDSLSTTQISTPSAIDIYPTTEQVLNTEMGQVRLILQQIDQSLGETSSETTRESVTPANTSSNSNILELATPASLSSFGAPTLLSQATPNSGASTSVDSLSLTPATSPQVLHQGFDTNLPNGASQYSANLVAILSSPQVTLYINGLIAFVLAEQEMKFDQKFAGLVQSLQDSRLVGAKIAA